MAETQLITISDVSVYRKIDPKFNTDRFNAFVTDVQRKNLRGLLGDSLYYAFMNDSRASGIYKTLLDGTTYEYNSETIKYYGLKPCLCYWILAIMAREGDLFLSQHGAIQFTNNSQQNFENAKQKEQVAANYMETAAGYANDVIKFLNENASSYPLWNSGTEKNESNFTTFRI